MIEKVALIWAVLLVTTVAVSVADQTIDSSKPTKIIKEKPIIINTVAQHYENPTIGQYELCTKARDDCVGKCGYRDDTCRDACPICPILIDQDILVQGINDTLYRLPMAGTKVNQTNIIRLTNEIRNIIETSLGNITAHNQNNIVIHQNRTSITGGKYGLGYDDKGPCCHIIEPRKCKRSATGRHCLPRHQRTCGPHCISRVMRANRVVQCNELNSEDCSQAIEYQPQPRRPGCQYTSTYPFINCRKTSRSVSSRGGCSRCYSIPYMYVMRGQVPRYCLSCYGRTGGQQGMSLRSYYQPSPAPMYYGGYNQYPPMYPSYQPYYQARPYISYIDDGDSIDDGSIDNLEVSGNGNGWELEERKCIDEHGAIIENCTTDDNNSRNSGPQSNDEYEDGDFDNAEGVDYDYGEEDTVYRSNVRVRGRRAASKK